MSEGRANTQAPDVDDAESVDASAGRSPQGQKPAMTRQVLVRISDEDAELLATVREQLDAGSPPETFRSAVRFLGEALTSASTADEVEKKLARLLAAQQAPRLSSARTLSDLDDDTLAAAVRAAEEVTAAIRERAREINYIGHNFNLIVRAVLAGDEPVADALDHIGRALDMIGRRMIVDDELTVPLRNLARYA